jgi:hypothetical protein
MYAWLQSVVDSVGDGRGRSAQVWHSGLGVGIASEGNRYAIGGEEEGDREESVGMVDRKVVESVSVQHGGGPVGVSTGRHSGSWVSSRSRGSDDGAFRVNVDNDDAGVDPDGEIEAVAGLV